MKTADAKKIVDEFAECSKRCTPGTGITPYHIYAKDHGITLIADAVSLIVKAQRTLEKSGKNPGDVPDRERGAF